MGLADDLRQEVDAIFRYQWSTRDGRVVPDPEDLQLGNEAVHFDRATILYADLTASTALVNTKSWSFAAEVYKAYLLCAARLIRDHGGEITSYDGDRVMGVFIADNQTTSAAKCALKINYAVQKIANVRLEAQYPNAGYSIRHVVGIDTSEIWTARTGVRGGNDLVWVGRAANYAAKLTELREGPRSWITEAGFKRMGDEAKYGGDPRQLMWRQWRWTEHDGSAIYSSNWWRAV